MSEPQDDDSIWTLLDESARLQAQMGRDMVAWAQAYEAAGRAMQGNAETAALLARLGRRGERFLQRGPSASAQQALQLFLNPLQALAGGMPGPLSKLWEAWAATLPGAQGESPTTKER
jgi:hypothetical protein